MAIANRCMAVCLWGAVVGCGGELSVGNAAAGGTPGKSGIGGTSSGGAASATGGTATTGVGLACPGLPTEEQDPAAVAAGCNGAVIEPERQPLDLVLLLDRSIANSYAIGAVTATPAMAGQVRRWDLLTSAIEALAATEQAKSVNVAATFFGRTGDSDDALNCNSTDYAIPDIALGLLSDTGPAMVAAMQAMTPAGLAPIVPALTGAYRYAMAEQQQEPTRPKAVVLVSDSFPTQCSLKSPSDVVNVINEAATAPVPIPTFIISVGVPTALTTAKFNLQNYARAGNTGKTSYLIDESVGAEAAQTQLVAALLEIATSASCKYLLAAPSDGRLIDPTRITLFFQPALGSMQQIPGGDSGMASCARSRIGGWFPDDPNIPTIFTLCPCSCAGVGNGRLSVVYGCSGLPIDDDP
jgi:hypothetical protein